MKTTHRAARALLCLLPWLLLAAAPAARALDWYTVEVLVFAEQNADGMSEEAWSSRPGWPNLDGTVRPGSGEFDAVGGSSLELSAVARQLDRSGRYRTLLLTGWRQPGYGPRRAVPVHVTSDGGGLIPPAAGSNFGSIVTQPHAAGVEGLVKVHRSRYLHVLVDLVYARPAPAAAPVAEGAAAEYVPTLFRLTGTRRMRSRELHYYDHPLFGVLVKITPYGVQQEAEPEDESAAPDAAQAE